MESGRSSRLSVSSLAEGAPPPPVLALRDTLRQSTRPSQPTQPQRPDTEKEELRVQVNTLKFELENIKQERDVTALRHEKELRDLQFKADADFRKCQTAETSSHRANHKSEALAKELKEAQETTLNEKAGFERKIRTLNDQNQALQEELSDTQAQLSDQERQFKYQINELDTVRSSLQRTIEDMQNDIQQVKDDLQTTQERLSEREATVANLETENIRLKAEGSDAETLAVLKRELSDQVHHMRTLESTNREQVVELRHLRKIQKNVEVVEEQKKSLENQLQLMKEIESELGTVQIQKQILEDERSSWTTLLQDNDQPAEFDTPDAVVKALLQERIEKAAFVDKMGTVEAQFLEKDEIIKSLEADRKTLRQELAKLQAAGGAANPMTDSRAKARLERQRALAVKEVEYLRAQLKTFDTEEITMNADENRFDEQKSQQIANLEKVIDEYRAELQKVHEELSKREEQQPSQAEDLQQPRGLKRPLSPAESDTENNERLSVLSRKNRGLQDALSKSEQNGKLLHQELKAAKHHLKSLQAKSRTRVLELRDNPTAQTEIIKMSTLTTLKAENRDLLAQLHRSSADVKVVPASALESMKLDIQDMERSVADKEKRMRRLKEIWTAKSSEFREAVASLLGFKLDFLPNGRVRVTSMFHLSAAYRHGDPGASPDSRGPGSMGNGEENSIIFDGENGTMKISGGPNSLFAMEIKPLIKFWVEERKDIPCFLAAMTLDFYDKTTRAGRI